MTSLTSSSQIVFKNTHRETIEMIQCLAYDDDYRELFEKSPRKALAKYSIFVPEEIDFEDVKLPSKEEMRAILTDAAVGKPLEVLNFVGRPQAIVHVFFVFLAFFAFFRRASFATPHHTED